MPNECYNQLSITGPQEDVDQFRKDARSYDGYNGCCEEGRSNQLDINNFIPMPVELKERTAPEQDPKMAAIFKEKYGAEDWYTWAIENWGTKWGAYDVLVKEKSRDPALLTYEYTTAWSPFKEEVMCGISRLYPTLRFEHYYDEPMMEIHGDESYENGKMVHQMNTSWEEFNGSQYTKSTSLDIIPTERK